jgi:hypothetical protein
MSCCPDLSYGSVNDGLQLGGVGIGISSFDVLNYSMEDSPSNYLFNELRKISLLHALRTQESAEREVCIF